MENQENQTKENELWQQQLNELLVSTPPRSKKGKAKKWIIIGGVAVIVLFFVLRGMGGSNAAVIPVMTQSLQRQDVKNILSIQGPVSGTNSVDVVSRLNAEITEIYVKEGDLVEKDQILAIIDEKELQREVEMAQNAYDLALITQQDQQRQAEAGYQKSSQNLQVARKRLQRLKTLVAAGGASQVELEEAQAEVNAMQAELDTYVLKDGVAVASDTYELQIEQARMELDKKKENLEDAKLKSPISGTVVRVNSKVGQLADTVEADKPIFIIENLDSLEMKINVSEYSIGKVTIGQQVVIRADILNGETIAGEVVSISPTGEEKGGGSTERVIPVTIRIADENTRLIAGITAKADILLEEENDVFAVPLSSIIYQEDQEYIAVAESQTVRMIAVTTGVESDVAVAINAKQEGELVAGMAVILNAESGLTEGMAVSTEGE